MFIYKLICYSSVAINMLNKKRLSKGFMSLLNNIDADGINTGCIASLDNKLPNGLISSINTVIDIIIVRI